MGLMIDEQKYKCELKETVGKHVCEVFSYHDTETGFEYEVFVYVGKTELGSFVIDEIYELDEALKEYLNA